MAFEVAYAKGRVLQMKMQGQTPRSDVDICLNCSLNFERRDDAGEVTRICMAMQPTGVKICHKIVSCSMFSDKRIPNLYHLKDIAWEISPDKRPGRAGFTITPPEDKG